ncbi:YbjQ family protein [Methanococcus voltae]|uniref:UPF0145 protein J3E07_000718 n=2 Tax=Methanococcus voltae TaxID=2188 RepID=A0A8J7S0U2_METVO|nr:YbjQ family protein [Methanococcus voltae]MBP2171742.1 uncharacterized protein YbjQ (UPF0145 family) [Methanococcus voltae]MBP2201320.1 uncharacterized protein YbjQ (UPF0145 family) [Methanococcus voltae]MCS3922738.1 uncharacterized protein YbjQ (UPF0145 family) [Methanococcus voltae PS]
MLVTTQNKFVDHKIEETLGIAKGNTARAKNIGKDIMAGFRNIVGGEIPEYTEMIAGSREQAMDRMIEDAQRMGADAVVCVRFETSQVMQGVSELLCYGTAVKLKK